MLSGKGVKYICKRIPVKHTYIYFYKLAIEAISAGCGEDLCPINLLASELFF